MEKEPVILTKEGYEKLEEELNFLKSVKRNEISERIKVAREFGDLSENKKYEAAREEQANMESRILYIEEQLKHAHIMDSKTVSTKVVSVGTKVRVYDYDLEEEFEYSIVGKTRRRFPTRVRWVWRFWEIKRARRLRLKRRAAILSVKSVKSNWQTDRYFAECFR